MGEVPNLADLFIDRSFQNEKVLCGLEMAAQRLEQFSQKFLQAALGNLLGFKISIS